MTDDQIRDNVQEWINLNPINFARIHNLPNGCTQGAIKIPRGNIFDRLVFNCETSQYTIEKDSYLEKQANKYRDGVISSEPQ